MSRGIRISLLLIAAAVLLCILAYPFGYDNAVFSVGGEMVLKHGAVTYRDFLDTKPPLIFIIYGGALSIFGHHEWAPRLFDVIFQIVSLLYFYIVLRKVFLDEVLAFISVCLYAIYYSTSGFWMTGQSETFALLPSVWIFSLTEATREERSPLFRGILAGIASIVLFLLKFTLLTVPLGAMIYLFLSTERGSMKKNITFCLSLVITLLLGIGSYAVYLINSGAYSRFMEAVGWLNGYSNLNPLGAFHTWSEVFFRQFPAQGLLTILPTGAILATIGVYFLGDRERRTPAYHLLIQIGLGLFAVLLERKNFLYQYSRIYWAEVPMISMGAMLVSARFKVYLRSISTLGRFPKMLRYVLVIITICAAAVFSPITRIFSNPLYWVYAQVRGNEIGRHVEEKFGNSNYQGQIEAADAIKADPGSTHTAFFWGNSVGFYFWLGSEPQTICLTNTPFVTAWSPHSWRDTLLAQLNSTSPQYIVVESDDARPYITGDELDSKGHLEAWHELSSFVHDHYAPWKEVHHFSIYKRM